MSDRKGKQAAAEFLGAMILTDILKDDFPNLREIFPSILSEGALKLEDAAQTISLALLVDSMDDHFITNIAKVSFLSKVCVSYLAVTKVLAECPDEPTESDIRLRDDVVRPLLSKLGECLKSQWKFDERWARLKGEAAKLNLEKEMESAKKTMRDMENEGEVSARLKDYLN